MVMVIVRAVVDNDLRILSYTCNATKSNADGVIVASFDDVSSNYDDSISVSSGSCCCCSGDSSDGNLSLIHISEPTRPY